jgi:hypothetical protein
MVQAFIKIRLTQLFRGIIGIGIFRIIFLILLFGYLMTFVFLLTENQTNALYVVGTISLLTLWIQTKRKDKVFLKTNFEKYKLIYFAEYLALSFIAIIFLTIHLQWIPLLILLATFSLIIQLDIKMKQRSLNTKLQRMIPSECFEWKAGVRKTIFILIPVWLIGFFTSFLTGSVPIVMFILGIIPLSFYETGESYQMIIVYEKGTNSFLFYKIKMQILLFSIITIPLITAFVVFHYEIWYIPIAEYFIFISIHTYSILTKYAFYEPNNKSQAAVAFGTIGALGGIIPVFLPVVWLLSIRFFLKSRENLKLYLNDFN